MGCGCNSTRASAARRSMFGDLAASDSARSRTGASRVRGLRCDRFELYRPRARRPPSGGGQAARMRRRPRRAPMAWRSRSKRRGHGPRHTRSRHCRRARHGGSGAATPPTRRSCCRPAIAGYAGAISSSTFEWAIRSSRNGRGVEHGAAAGRLAASDRVERCGDKFMRQVADKPTVSQHQVPPRRCGAGGTRVANRGRRRRHQRMRRQ